MDMHAVCSHVWHQSQHMHICEKMQLCRHNVLRYASTFVRFGNCILTDGQRRGRSFITAVNLGDNALACLDHVWINANYRSLDLAHLKRWCDATVTRRRLCQLAS